MMSVTWTSIDLVLPRRIHGLETELQLEEAGIVVSSMRKEAGAEHA